MSRDSARVVLRYYAYRATGNPGFFYPIYTLFLLRNGLTFTEIGVIATIQSLVVLVGEVPTGYIGDRIGRRNSLVIASLLFLVSTGSYLVATDFLGFTVTFVTLSLGHTFTSGSGSAWLYDTLAEFDMAEEFTRVSGRAGAISKWVMSATLVAGGVLYVMDPYYPFLAALGMGVINLTAVLSLPKNVQYADRGEKLDAGPGAGPDDEVDTDNEDERDDTLTVLEAIPVVRNQLLSPGLRSFVGYMALFSGALMTADMYIQPIARDALRGSFGPILDTWGVPEAATLGLLYAAFTVVSAITSDYAGDVEERFGVRNALLVIPVIMAVLYVLPVFVPLLAFPMFFVMKGSTSLIFPISGRYINDRVESVGRATVLSAVSMVRGLAGVPFRVGSGVIADYATPLVGVAALGAIFLVLSFALHLWSPPVHEASADGADADSEPSDTAPE